ncbi:MAG TPA: translation elongation factor Ts [Candidatus Acidoferrales bacterium]|nr:translation elongation factor Ts [Candidatus Acidoferrales bacterium]
MSTQPGKDGQPQISAQLVKTLRERTGAGFSDCRNALLEANGDLEAAVTILRERGQAAAKKKAQREATEGAVGTYLHAGGKIAVLVEVNCESDFVARTDEFQRLCHDVAMHVAALDPRYVRREDVPADIVERERKNYLDQARSAGKPENLLDRIVEGKLEKFFAEGCLYEQHFIKDEQTTIRDLIQQTIAKVGENIAVRRFARFKVGEHAAPPDIAPAGTDEAQPGPA